MKLFNFFKNNKYKYTGDNISGEDICRIYYLLKSYQYDKSNNIAVMKNMKKFKWQIKTWKDKLNPLRGDCVIKLSDTHYRFIYNEQEVNIIYIDSLHNLQDSQFRYKKFM